mmetsp:Transcript_39217/g.94379  ORF Transcript_39217/g.94379 Transcript_39217/m.94379 type:complete len:231 (+) Transcript_39217:2307-2999(+)
MGAEPSSASASAMLTPSLSPSPFHHSSIFLAVSTHSGTTPPVLDELPFSPSPALAFALLTIRTSLASIHAVFTPSCFKYAYSVCALQISPNPVTTSMTLGGTLRIILRLCTTLSMSLASLRMRSSMGPVISGGARSARMASCPSRARSSSASARCMSCRAESTTATSWSVMPPRAETTAMVGMGPECRPSSSASSSPSSFFMTRPELSRMSRSPTVRYSPASASDAPPNL